MTDLGLPRTDLLVRGEVSLGVRDHGRHPRGESDHGWRGDVLLVPPVRGTVDDWDTVATLLRGLGYRPVATEPRGHGRSGTGTWTWPAVVADLAAVADALALDRPAVIGHGLGGAVATFWAGQHPECPLAVSIDGFGNPNRAAQWAGFAGGAEAIDAFSDYLSDALRELPETLRQALRAVEDLVVLDVYRAVRCPTAALVSEESDLAEVLPTELGLVWLSYRDWVTAALTTLQREVAPLSVLRISGSNDAYLTHPEQLAGLLAELLPEPSSVLTA
ncbi:alpha/beta fold hydrolase [Cryptosporangium minutisporangium]|uniref:AB hydrolase-1 domain-containing protein n=1 Tax=Cryptosporangium minutisporangium TaxID=113569 RepID=A0ABP6T4K5_9ACTN